MIAAKNTIILCAWMIITYTCPSLPTYVSGDSLKVCMYIEEAVKMNFCQHSVHMLYSCKIRSCLARMHSLAFFSDSERFIARLIFVRTYSLTDTAN